MSLLFCMDGFEKVPLFGTSRIILTSLSSEDMWNIYLGTLLVLMVFCECYHTLLFLQGCVRLESQKPTPKKKRELLKRLFEMHNVEVVCFLFGVFRGQLIRQISHTPSLQATVRQELCTEHCSHLENNRVKALHRRLAWNTECIICLESYKSGEAIVFSSNPECRHAFHEECLINYFIHLSSETPLLCPCCRQAFLCDVCKKPVDTNCV